MHDKLVVTLNAARRFSFSVPASQIKTTQNGIYVVFEVGEKLNIGEQLYERIVRVGTHRAPNRLAGRINDHRRNSGTSVFRGLINECLVGIPWNKNDQSGKSMYKANATNITNYFTNNLSYTIINTNDLSAEERRELESRISQTFANANRNSAMNIQSNWLGMKLQSPDSRAAGLYSKDKNDLSGTGITNKDFDYIVNNLI